MYNVGSQWQPGLPPACLKIVVVHFPQTFQNPTALAVLCAAKLDCAFVNILTIANLEDEYILTQQSIDHPVVTDAILSEPGKLALECRIGFGLFDQFRLDKVKNSFRFGLR